MIGGYALGWLADKIGPRKALILSSVLAGVFIWPFAYVTNYPGAVVLSIADTLGFAGYLAINVVYMSEIMGPTVRRRVMMVCQVRLPSSFSLLSCPASSRTTGSRPSTGATCGCWPG